MGRGKLTGYTIVEVLLFLAVSSMLFFAAVTAIGGRQAQVQFGQAARDLESKLNDIINDVSTGYFPKTNYSCSLVSGNIAFSSTVTAQQGSSDDCVFLGKVLQFAPDSGADRINIYTVVGKRSGTTLTSATPKVVYDTGNSVDITEQFQNKWGLKVTKVAALDAPAYTTYGDVGFVTRLTSSAGSSGAALTDFMLINNSTPLGVSKDVAVTTINNNLATSAVNPANGLIICLADADGTRKAGITIGSNSRGPEVKLDIDSYNTAACS